MKLVIPKEKELRDVAFPRILTINFNGFDINLLLPSLFFAVLSDGAQVGRRVNDPTALSAYTDKLIKHPALDGFDTPQGSRILERIVRSDLVEMGYKGRSHSQEQILSITPYSLLACKPGFPALRTRQRGVDTFLYQALLSALGGDRPGNRHYVSQRLQEHFKDIFGHGVRLDLSNQPAINGQYDGVTPLDIVTRLSLAFLDGFEPISKGRKVEKSQPRASCPEPARLLGDDILHYLFAYCNHMSSNAFTHNLKALINFELFIYSLKVIHAINALVDNPETLPDAMNEDSDRSGPELYLDFTGRKGSLSQQMTAWCVQRDLEMLQRYLGSNLLLRRLGYYIEQMRKVPAQAQNIAQVLGDISDGPQYLQGLLLLMNDDKVGARIELKAEDDMSVIRVANADESKETTDELAWLDDELSFAKTAVDQLIAALSEGIGKQVLSNYIKWYWSVGGIQTPFGILTGTLNVRQSWRYAPSNDLLAVFVQLAAIHGNTHPQPIRLREFLDYLERRFGILIDRPPSSYSGAEAAAAARENLRAMLDRLRQMGIFSDMSDDFTVQRLQPPYADSRSTNLLSKRS